MEIDAEFLAFLTSAFNAIFTTFPNVFGCRSGGLEHFNLKPSEGNQLYFLLI